MTLEDQLTLLREGSIEIVGRIVASSNQALLVEVRRGDAYARACYKCERGERPLWDFPEGLWRREVAAFELDQALGTDLVPATVARFDAPLGPGSLQWWVDDNETDHYFTLREDPRLQPFLIRLCAFDVVANNADRKSGHVLFDGDRCWAIDNGLSFHVEEKLRTVIWDFAETALPAPLRSQLRAFGAGAVGELGRWLSADELAATQARATALARAGRLPEPDDSRPWPPYPWPLV